MPVQLSLLQRLRSGKVPAMPVDGRLANRGSTPTFHRNSVALEDGAGEWREAVCTGEGDALLHAVAKVPVSSRDPTLPGKDAGGHSRDNICIAFACEEREDGSSVFCMLERGKPTGERNRTTYYPHLSRPQAGQRQGVLLQRGRAQDRNGCPTTRTRFGKVNRLCLLLRLFLDGHTCFGRSDFGG